jgi:hypothetical protein
MTEAALRLIAEQMSADAEFAKWVCADPGRALREVDLTPDERDRLLRMTAPHDRGADDVRPGRSSP